jgi:hypothetical protein
MKKEKKLMIIALELPSENTMPEQLSGCSAALTHHAL